MKIYFNFGHIVGKCCFIYDEALEKSLKSKFKKPLPDYTTSNSYAEMVEYCVENKNFPSFLGIKEIKRIG